MIRNEVRQFSQEIRFVAFPVNFDPVTEKSRDNTNIADDVTKSGDRTTNSKSLQMSKFSRTECLLISKPDCPMHQNPMKNGVYVATPISRSENIMCNLSGKS